MLSKKFCDTVHSKFLFISMYSSLTRNGWIEVAIGEMFVSIYFMFQRFLISFIGLFFGFKINNFGYLHVFKQTKRSFVWYGLHTLVLCMFTPMFTSMLNWILTSMLNWLFTSKPLCQKETMKYLIPSRHSYEHEHTWTYICSKNQ